MRVLEQSRRSERERRGVGLRPVVEALEGRALMARAGLLDPAFGVGGLVVQGFGNGTTATINAVAVQPDGKIVAVGEVGTGAPTNQSDWIVLRYTAAGTLDPTFGQGGLIVTSFTGEVGSDDAVVIQPDGKIVVGGSGSTFNGLPLSSVTFGLVTRYNTNGSLDTTFGDGGSIALIGGHFSQINAMALDAGKIVATGGTSPDSLEIARLDADGTLDTTFGPFDDGYSRLAFPIPAAPSGVTVNPTSVSFSAVAVEPDGTIVAGGALLAAPPSAISEWALATFSPTGLNVAMAADFAGQTLVASALTSLTTLPDGTILAEGTVGNTNGTNGSNVFLAEYHENLTLATAFGSGGHMNTLPGLAAGMVVQPNGQIVVSAGQSPGTFVARYNANGSPDPTFGFGGVTPIATVGGLPLNVASLAFSPVDDTIVFGGDVGTIAVSPRGILLGKLFAATTPPAPPRVTPAIALRGLSIKAVAGQSFTQQVATVTITATAGIRPIIAWGDGTFSAGTLVPFQGAFAVVGTHRYAPRGLTRRPSLSPTPPPARRCFCPAGSITVS